MNTTGFRRMSLIFILKAALVISGVSLLSIAAQADPDDLTWYYFKCNAAIDQGWTVWFYWDVQQDGDARKVVQFNVRGPASQDDIAKEAAALINQKVGKDIAHAGEGGEVDLDLGWRPTDDGIGYTATLGSYRSIVSLDGRFNFGPDLFTGGTYLTGPGSYSVTGPNGMYASFTAPSGTSADTLAAEFAAVMSTDGFNAHSEGSAVVFRELAGGIEFTPVGTGLDYGLFPTPEPSTRALYGLAVVGIGGLWRKRLLP